ncbi:MAG: glutamate-5-semialdehyde dehydrogenase [Bacteroidaceae bacterium]|nr:glutamate-5-semialdehyde dehydrogenase [Bacteroidaceae bacterium]
MDLTNTFKSVREASRKLLKLDTETINQVLLAVADAAEAKADYILAENQKDLDRMEPSNPLYDRLKLTKERLYAIAADTRNVVSLPSPLGKVLKETVRPNGLIIRKVSFPFGVVGVIYEARPNVTFDVFSLCFKSGNAVLLKGGSNAHATNLAIVEVLHEVLKRFDIDTHAVELLPASHDATAEMLQAVGLVDVIIPRGSSRLIQFVRENAKVPVIETGAGICHTYFDAEGDLEKGKAIIHNAKTRRVTVCNAMDCLLLHESRLSDLPALCAPLATEHVVLYADEPAYKVLKDSYPTDLLYPATPESYGTEFLDYKMAIKTVSGLQEAIEHINGIGSGHSESIVTENKAYGQQFCRDIDAACVYVNAPTSFSDGAQFGLGAEVGISTQKMHPRGPMGLEEITTYKWLIEGNGQTRAK